ncbi:formate dehydrogenase accessory sulfurtransferase FdhD [Granulicella mallensis]|uniref:Sulfur carrier protein FdhD n=1 Tax=Granulicella mallensis (strain ATCC BAA-1857 / DSM 23137 / MP5ACTX8) TaxID=682795 RepID=G8P061_GRAMM|nr:formate dehydrogenase accessory sulfurtransferase FdhD [Granulicella mallensis]AEU36855.1 formate dehydrogenase family accessory protein FdhD [Granulicella mallensis MP5ACTX8]
MPAQRTGKVTSGTLFGTITMQILPNDQIPAIENNRSTAPVSIYRVDSQGSALFPDTLAVEEPLEIQLTHGPRSARTTKSITVTMRTPGHDEELAAGFLLTEGVLEDSAQIVRIDAFSDPLNSEPSSGSTLPASTPGNIVRVELEPDVEVRTATLERNFYTTSSCGICGKASLLALRSVCPPRRANTLSISAEILYVLPEALRTAQRVFDATGGLHGAGLFTAEGEFVLSREDVGRHNAVDKLLGAQFLADAIPLRDKVLMLSGRASFELLQKAVMAGIPMVAAVGAPSSLAVQVARDFDITLIGFLRDRHFNVYHGIEHITGHKMSREVSA